MQAGFFPGIIFYFSIWYLREQHTFRMAIFYCGVLLSGAFGGILVSTKIFLASVYMTIFFVLIGLWY